MDTALSRGGRSGAEAAERVRALEDLGVLGTGPEERFDRITRVAQRLFGVDSALITLISHDRQWFKSSNSRDVTALRGSDVFYDVTISGPETLVVRDAATDPRFADSPLVVGEPHVRFYAGHPITSPGGYRIGTLCLLDARPRDFSTRECAQLQDLAAWAQEELQGTTELDRAAEVQRGLQPHASSMVVPGYDLAGVCFPSRTVGGDLLDWYRSPDGDVMITLGDVMGKGMGAAIMMATVRGAMRTAGRLHPPAEALRRAGGTLDEDLQLTGTIVTVCHVRVTPATGEVRYGDAGHGLGLLIRADGSHERLPSGGLPLGVLTDDRWDEHRVHLCPGDTLVSFSDGLLELYGDNIETTIEVVLTVNRESPDARSLVDYFAALARRSHLTDDVTVFALHRSPSPEPPSPEPEVAP